MKYKLTKLELHSRKISVTELFKGPAAHTNNKSLIKTEPAWLWWW
jgi:hypothetical protein